MSTIGKVSGVSNSNEATKRVKGKRVRNTLRGLSICFITKESITIGDIVEFTYKDKDYNFKVKEVLVNDKDTLEVVALEVGYYGLKLGRVKDLDLRELYDLELIRIMDKDVIKSINESELLT